MVSTPAVAGLLDMVQIYFNVHSIVFSVLQNQLHKEEI